MQAGISKEERIGIAVGVGSAPSSARLVRWAHKNASLLNLAWGAFHVDGGTLLSNDDRERLEANLDLARGLGGKVWTIVGSDVVSTLIDAASTRGATILVIGRSGLSSAAFFPRKATISDRILREAGSLDVVVVSDSPEKRSSPVLAALRGVFNASPRQYLLLLAAFCLVTLACLALSPLVGTQSVALIYLGAVLMLSLVSGPVPIALMALLSSLAYNFFFIPPRFTFAIASPEDILLFSLYFLVAAVTGFLSSGLRSRERLLQRRDKEASFLLAATEKLSGMGSAQEAAEAAAALVARYTSAPAVVYINANGGQRDWYSIQGADELGAEDKSMARTCAERGEPCGLGTRLSSGASYRFIPASGAGKTVAAIGYKRSKHLERFSSEDELFMSLGRSLALFIEREHSAEVSRKAALELESERLAKVLFDSVSHELKTPLTMVTGTLSALKDEVIASNPAARAELVEGALASSQRLSQVVEDFLSIGRMESGRLKLKLELVGAEDLVAAATAAIRPSLAGRAFTTTIPSRGEAYRIDAVLAARLIGNLLENACRYSKKGGAIELRLVTRGRGLSVMVIDEGPGFSEERMRAPFVKFRRAEGDMPGGLGLGLAICRGIVQAHGGDLFARHSPGSFEIEAYFPDCIGMEASCEP
jgi:two-component system sensor histidine kinase KdpD